MFIEATGYFCSEFLIVFTEATAFVKTSGSTPRLCSDNFLVLLSQINRKPHHGYSHICILIRHNTETHTCSKYSQRANE